MVKLGYGMKAVCVSERERERKRKNSETDSVCGKKYAYVVNIVVHFDHIRKI